MVDHFFLLVIVVFFFRNFLDLGDVIFEGFYEILEKTPKSVDLSDPIRLEVFFFWINLKRMDHF